MSLVSIVNLAERLLNQTSSQGQSAQDTQKTANGQDHQDSQRVAEDQFTPSTQGNQTQSTAQDAGLFSVAQFSFFSAAADFLLGQSAVPQASQPIAATHSTNESNSGPQTPLAPANITPASATLAQNSSAGSAQTNATNANNTQLGSGSNLTAVPSTAPTSAGSATAQQQLQALNQAFAALGLSPQDIQKLDRIASIIKDFNPAAYTALVYQLEELAQQASQQTSAPTSQQANATNASNTQSAAQNDSSASSGTAANGAAFQVQELVIKFSGVDAQGVLSNQANANTATQAASSNSNTSFQVSGFNLQIEEVNLTLANANGQIAQIQAPLPAANSNTTSSNQITPRQQTKAAGA